MSFDKLVERITEAKTIREHPEEILLDNAKYPRSLMADVVEEKTGRRPIYPGETVMGVQKIKNFYEILRKPQRRYERKEKPKLPYII